MNIFNKSYAERICPDFLKEEIEPNKEKECIERRNIPVDLYEGEKEFFVMIDCPGIKKEDIDLQMTENELKISIKNQFDSSEYNMQEIIRERIYQSERIIPFTSKIDISHGSVSAKYCDGVLYVSVKKAAENSGVSIKIE